MVYLVGAGPGAPDLLTVRAARVLATATVVFHDALVHPETLALAKAARLVDVGKRSGRVSTEQRFINRALVEAAIAVALIGAGKPAATPVAIVESASLDLAQRWVGTLAGLAQSRVPGLLLPAVAA